MQRDLFILPLYEFHSFSFHSNLVEKAQKFLSWKSQENAENADWNKRTEKGKVKGEVNIHKALVNQNEVNNSFSWIKRGKQKKKQEEKKQELKIKKKKRINATFAVFWIFVGVLKG